jgi:hypothetical protein
MIQPSSDRHQQRQRRLRVDELQTLLEMLNAMIELGDLTDLELFEQLEPEQKQQVWMQVPMTLRKAIYDLKVGQRQVA